MFRFGFILIPIVGQRHSLSQGRYVRCSSLAGVGRVASKIDRSIQHADEEQKAE